MKEAGHAEDGQVAKAAVRFVLETSTPPCAESDLHLLRALKRPGKGEVFFFCFVKS